ncbi:MAG: CotH kinase family protein [Bacteroidetes bacterium]|nr:CotH kinase family protein [Bacteroidota bacterium]
MKTKINTSRLLKRSILVLLLLACIGVFVAHKMVQRYGFDGIGEFISVYRANKSLADQAEPQDMQLLLSDSDYDFLKKRRDVALERGIQINDGEDNYVPCKIVQGDDTVKGEMRLKGHMTDHLEGEKWSFRIKTNKKPVFGMTRFSLQAPGTRNYAYEWVYHQLLKKEGIIHLNYDFIRLKLNEKDLGIYAIEEHFGQHVLAHNDRPAGAILRWNPNLYWEWRIDELQGTYLDEQYSAYSSAFVEPYEKGTVEKDSLLIQTYQKGAALLEAFRRGEKKTSEVFDVQKMARFHAIIDLVGGHHSLDWSDVKFFYNSETGFVEPVGYESFSVRKTESIAGQRIPDTYDKVQFNYHNQLFSDPVFFAAYIRELERISDEVYLDNFIAEIQPELNKKLGILAHEFPYRKFTFDPYFENIELIRHNLELPKPFHAFLEETNDSMVQISVTPVSDFPIEILSMTVDGKDEFALDSLIVLPAKARNTYAHYFRISVQHDAAKLKNIRLKARIPGSSYVFEVEVSDLPSYNQSSSGYQYNQADQGKSALVKLNDSVSFFNSKNVTIDGVYVLTDTNHTLRFFPGQQIEFLEGGKLITCGKIEMIGGSEEGEEIHVTCHPDNTINEAGKEMPEEFIFLDGGKLECHQVTFQKASKMIRANEADMYFTNCAFADTDHDFIHAGFSNLVMLSCASGTMQSLGTFDRSLVRIKDFTAHNGSIFIRAYGSDVDMVQCTFSGFESIGSLNYSSSVSAWASVFSVSSSIATLNNSSDFRIYAGEIQKAPVGFIIDPDRSLPGESTYLLYGTQASAIVTLESGKN